MQVPQGGDGGWKSMEVKSGLYTTLSECIWFMKTGPHSKDLPWLVSTWVALACFHLGMTHTCLEQSYHLSSLCSRISEEKISPKRLWLPSRLVGGLWGWIKFLNTAITEHIWYVFNSVQEFLMQWCCFSI